MREWAEPQVPVMFYWVVVQSVLLFGAEIWVLLAAMFWKLEGVHVRFLRQIMGHKAKWKRDGTW